MNAQLDRVLRVATLLLCATGFLARLAPLFDQGGRMLRQFPTEDGYLMLTIARNIALGHGFSIAGGEIPSNGTQPLATLLFAACFWLVDGDREAGVRLVLVAQIVLGTVAAALLFLLARRLLERWPLAGSAAAFTAATWYASPIVVRTTMNCLETALYAAAILAAALAFSSRAAERRWSVRRCLGFGFALGVAFLSRNDAVLFILGACLLHLARSIEGEGIVVPRRFAEATLFGAVSILVASPWLMFNLLEFGHVVPVSGRAEALHVAFGQNLGRVPALVIEYALVVLPIPRQLQQAPALVALSALLCLVAVVAYLRARARMDLQARRAADLGVFFLAALALFYGLFFGAGHFMERYLFPASPFLATAWGGLLVAACARSSARFGGKAGALAIAAACLLVVIGDARLYSLGGDHMHFQVVQWVQTNLDEETWVGAPQSGTLGFFHDRTLNLDGKVNPAALEARSESEIENYMLSQRIPYIVDWATIVDLLRQPALAANYRVLVHDPQQNLGVLRWTGDAQAAVPNGDSPAPDRH